MADARLELADEPAEEGGRRGAVAPPLPPDDPEAWYAPDVQSQDEVYPGVVVTVARRATDFAYRVREPVLTRADRSVLDRVERRLADGRRTRPRTRNAAVEVMTDGFPAAEGTLDRLVDVSPSARRRLTYHARSRVACLGELTPYALDDRIEVVDPGPERLVVHTGNYAPAVTELPPDPAFLDRLASERLERYTVGFDGFEIEVVCYRINRLGGDPVRERYAALEPNLPPGDREVASAVIDRLRSESARGDDDRVRERAESLLTGRVGGADRLGRWLGSLGLDVSPPPGRNPSARLADATYCVLRDGYAYGPLTVPLLDPTVDGVEVAGVGEPILVRRDGERIPTNLAFKDEAAYRRTVQRIAAAAGADLDGGWLDAVATLDFPETERVVECTLAPPRVSEGGATLSMRKRSAEVPTPVGLVSDGAISTELVALLWLCCEHRGAVVFSGPPGTGTTALLNAHVPFVPLADRPVSVADAGSEIDLPRRTGVSLVADGGVATGELLARVTALEPDVVLASGIEGEAGYRAAAECLNAGAGLVGTTTARDVEVLVERALDRGMVAPLLTEIDLVVFPERTGGDVVVDEVVELVDEPAFRDLDRTERSGAVTARGETVYWNGVARRTADGELESRCGDDSAVALFTQVAERTDRSPAAVVEEYRRKCRYVEYLVRRGVGDRETLCGLLADLEMDEAATVERLDRHSPVNETRSTDGTR